MDAGRSGIFHGHVPAIDHWISLGVASGSVLSCEISQTQPDGPPETHPLLDRLITQIEDESLDVRTIPVALTVPTDQRAVLEAIRDIPPGTSLTVEQLAARIPHDISEDHDAIRAAVRDHPLPLLVPDHRLTDAAGSTPPVVRATLRELEGLD